MSLRQYLVIMLMSTVLCWVAWVMVLINIDPFQDTGIGLAFFYVSLFFSLLGTLSILSFSFRYVAQKSQMIFALVRASFRDSFILSSALITVLFLQSKGYLNPATGGILLAIVVVFSIYTFLLNRSER